MAETPTESVQGSKGHCELSTGEDKSARHWRGQLRDACILGWILLAALLVVIAHRSFQKDSDPDFVYFYSAGLLVKEAPAQLFDYRVQREFLDRVQPSNQGTYGPNPHPPFVALFFRPLASLPFLTAYRMWMIATLSLYVAGLCLLMRHFLPDDLLYRSAWLCGGLLFWPFLGRTLLNGQLTAIGFFAISLALCEQKCGRYYASGAALSLCLYKPTLLIWLIPMLIVGRAGKTLVGFFSATSCIVIATTASFGGMQIWKQYAEMTVHVGEWQRFLNHADSLDVMALFSPVAQNGFARVMSLIAFCLGAATVIWVWRRNLRMPARAELIQSWAMTLPLTLLVNFYTPVYDSVLLIIGLTASAEALRKAHPTLFVSTCLTVLVASYVTTWGARVLHVQILSILVMALVAFQVWAYRSRPAVG
jgi:hypothetical protein